MKETLMRVVATAALMTGASVIIGATRSSGEHDDDKFVYAVNVLCGFGTTSINVHNPNERTITFIKKGIPLEFGQPTPPQEQQRQSLKPGWALLMGCQDIAALGAVGSTGTGDVIIDSTQALDVWAVYVSFVAGGGLGETRVVRVPPTAVKR
ncbi:MAG TPA: hypothetical protein VNZ26_06795 [Vicinamibacterales bacterium]|jgi:hypothetical protein|nr:hypothetical protein [Vicinamibacterales bacterium]